MRAAVFLAIAMLIGGAAHANPDAGASSKVTKPAGTVLTFYGLRRLEQDPTVSDAEKVREWRAFIERSEKQVEYARKAVGRWQEAAKLRLVASAQDAEGDESLGIRQRMAQWEAVIKAYPRSKEAAHARRRMDGLREAETARLIREAEAVEESGRPKVDRIRAWLNVIDWAPKSRAGKAADRRVDALQRQLFSEAESVDRIDRIDLSTKLEAWKDVLRGRPNPAQRGKAERRVKALEAKISG